MPQDPHFQVSIGWSVDTTANSVVQLSSNILRAATSDNVQVLALESCARFGSCLPMCLNIRSKMGKLARRQHVSWVFKYMALAAGYAAGDAPDYLASTDAGERFLALAATLLSYHSTFEAGKALLCLLDDFSPAGQFLPTSQQLKDLFEVLDLKIGCSGFGDYLMGWHQLIMTPENGFEPLFDLGPPRQSLERNRREAADIADSIPGADNHGDEDEGTSENEGTSLSQDFDSCTTTNVPPLDRSTLDESFTDSATRRKLQPKSLLGTSPKFSSYKYPHARDLAKIIRAMAEIERLGEANFAIFRVPAKMAVWVIAFVNWALGEPPNLRIVLEQPQRRLSPLPQSESKILVEVSQSSSAILTVHCYKDVGDLSSLLWESKSVATSFNEDMSTWSGMVQPRPYFKARLQELQTRYRLFHLTDAMLLMATELCPRLRNSDQPMSKWATKPFFNEIEVATVIKKALVDSSEYSPRVREVSKLREVWSHHSDDVVSLAISLFLELLILSLAENAHSEDMNFFIDSKLRNISTAFPMARKDMLEIFLDRAGPLTPDMVVMSPYQIHQAALLLTGADQSAGLLRPLISSKRGQVTYLSFIETMTLEGYCPLRVRVVPGWLQYEGARYACAVSEDTSMFSNVLDLSKVSEKDYSNTPESRTAQHAESSWFCSQEYNFLSLYFAPDLSTSISISPELFRNAPEGLIVRQGCMAHCPTMDDYSSDVVYCRTIAALLSDTRPEIFRVFECADSQALRLLVQAALTEHWLNMEDPTGFPENNSVCVIKGDSCLACALKGTEEILAELFQGSDLGLTKAIILI